MPLPSCYQCVQLVVVSLRVQTCLVTGAANRYGVEEDIQEDIQEEDIQEAGGAAAADARCGIGVSITRDAYGRYIVTGVREDGPAAAGAPSFPACLVPAWCVCGVCCDRSWSPLLSRTH